MTVERTGVEGRNRAAVFFMLAAVIGFSLTPPLIAVFRASEAPFLFNAAIYFGQAAFIFAFLAKTNGRVFASFERRVSAAVGLALAAAYAGLLWNKWVG